MVTSSENVARLAVLIDADNAQPAVIEALLTEVAALTAVTAGSPRTALSATPPHDPATDPPGPTFRQRFRTATWGDDRPASQDLRLSIQQSGGPILAS